MSEYKRLISYIYNYSNDEKKENVGYARIEARNNECRFVLHIKTPNNLMGSMDTYIIKRDDNSFNLLKLGESKIQNNLINSRYYTYENNILNLGYNLNDISGIVLYRDDSLYYGTQWDSKPILLRDIKLALQENNIQDEDNKIEENIEVKASEVEDNIEMEESESMLENKDEQVTEEIELKAAGAGLAGVINSVPNSELEDYKADPWLLANKFEDPSYVEEIFKDKEKVEIFEDKNIIACVKIEPSDIEKLPKEFWGIMNNSFLIHGYYNFKHIIFAIVNNNDKKDYILGVPGRYQNREGFMAKMFGFEFFKSVKSGKIKSGDFGYWIIYIKE